MNQKLLLSFLLLLAVSSFAQQFNGRPRFFTRPFTPRQQFGSGSPPTRSFPTSQQSLNAVRTSGPSSTSSTSSSSNHVFNGKSYVVTWRGGPKDLTWGGARNYCSSLGMRIVSLDDPAKSSHFLDLLGKEGAEFFWAGGRVNGNTLEWESGRREGIVPGTGFWSTRSLSGRPQPETGNECLAVLNNFYNDGVRWHDVGCEHKKPTVCEAI